MANVILFNDNLPNSLSGVESRFYMSYQTRAAGVYALASHLRRNGYTVKVIDHTSNLTLAGVKHVIKNNQQDLLWIGVGTTFFVFKGTGLSRYRQAWETRTDLYFENSILEFVDGDGENFFGEEKTGSELLWGSHEMNIVAKWCNDQYNIPVVVGGAFISNLLDGLLTNLEKNVYTIKGRAESFALNITKILEQDKSAELPLFVNNDHFDNTDFKLHGYEWDKDDNVVSDEWLPLELSRGCAFNCAYCVYDRRDSFDSYKNPKAVRDEILKNYDQFGVTKYLLVDDLYNDSKDKVRRMYDEVWSKLPFKPEWASYMRLDLFHSDPESIEIIKASGARSGSFGIETLHNKAGAKVGKGLGRERIINTLEQLKKSWGDEVLVAACFIAGLPDEPEESILETIDWCHNTDLLHGVKWLPLWITPPSHRKIVIRTHQITDNTEKYGINWLNDNDWVNKQGVTSIRADELASMGNQNSNIVAHFGYYVELRQLGWSHEQITKHCRNPKNFLTDFVESNPVAIKRINDKVKKSLNLWN